MIKKKITCAALLVLMFSCISSAASDTARAVPSDDVIKNEQSSDDNITEKPEEIQVTVADEKLNEAPEPVTEAVVTAPEEKQEQHPQSPERPPHDSDIAGKSMISIIVIIAHSHLAFAYSTRNPTCAMPSIASSRIPLAMAK